MLELRASRTGTRLGAPGDRRGDLASRPPARPSAWPGANDAGKSNPVLIALRLAPASVGGELDRCVAVAGDSIRRTARPHELAGRTGIVFQDPTTQRSGRHGVRVRGGRVRSVNLGWRPPESLVAVRARHCGRSRSRSSASGTRPAVRRPRHSWSRSRRSWRCAPACSSSTEPTAQLDPEATAQGDRSAPGDRCGGDAAAHRRASDGLLAALCTRVVVLEAGRVVPRRPGCIRARRPEAR